MNNNNNISSKTAKRKRNTTLKSGENSIEDSKSKDDNNNEKKEFCSICLETPQDSVKLSSCEHKFCYKCILQWSKQENTCPNCKRRFYKIMQITRMKSGNKQKCLRKVQEKNQPQTVLSINSNIDIDYPYPQYTY
jgi:hypothetical protein